MPEYLAPGVYVEETSFRARSVEGVGTSTTAFVGPTRKGPLASTQLDAEGNPPAPPELLTSFGDFVRIYGGLGDLPLSGSSSLNYLAHAVLHYFNEGGSRLYVSRVANGAVAASKNVGLDDAGNRVVIQARFPGTSGNGRVTVREVLSSVTRQSMDAAPEGSLVRANGSNPSEPARITGTTGSGLSVPKGAVLRLMVNGIASDVIFQGEHTEVSADAALAASTVLDDSNRTLVVALNGGTAQNVQLDAGSYSRANLALAINERLSGGYARLNGTTLVIGTDLLGFAGSVQVEENAAFRFNSQKQESGTFNDASNNLPNLANFDATALNAVLAAVNPALVSASTVGGRLVLSTIELGEAVTLAVADATDNAVDPPVVSAHSFLGLILPGPGDPPAQGSNVRLFHKQSDGSWQDTDTAALTLPTDPFAVVGNAIGLTVFTDDADGESDSYEEISLLRSSPRYLGTVLGLKGLTRADSQQRLFGFDIGDQVDTLELYQALFPNAPTPEELNEGVTSTHTLTGGTNGGEPGVGDPTQTGSYAAAFEQLRGLEDISIIAAPGHSAYNDATYRAVRGALIAHVSLPRNYRIAVLDTRPNLLPSEAREERAQIDSSRAALYYPWVTVNNPLARIGREDIPREINLPPSGFMCGIYARNDVERTVAKSPANEVVRGAIRFESDINFAQNQLLNPLGVNCLRFFPGRGYRVWGARTASSDPEWKYVNVRRYFLYLEASIDRGTQWAVFENNGERLWANVRETIDSFLYNEWVSGNLLGASAEEAYFVRCDRSTMTQNDLDNGRLICLIGVAALKPAEFVIFRIGQKTADTRS